MEQNSLREPIYTELFSHCSTLESVTESQIAALKKDQKILNDQMKVLSQKLDEIAVKIPNDDLDGCINRVDGICHRLEACWARIQNVNKRADKLIQTLEGGTNSVTQHITNRITNLISKEQK